MHGKPAAEEAFAVTTWHSRLYASLLSTASNGRHSCSGKVEASQLTFNCCNAELVFFTANFLAQGDQLLIGNAVGKCQVGNICIASRARNACSTLSIFSHSCSSACLAETH